jgi:hypothetical protein
MANGRSRLRSVFTVNRKTFFNPSGWIDYAALVDLNRTIADVIRNAFFLPKPDPDAKSETFAAAMKRQGLTEADIKNSRDTYKAFAIVFCILGFADLAYTFYLLVVHFSILGFVLGLATTALFFGQAFRFDFWAFQLSRRRLGLSVADWWSHLKGKKGKTND